MASAQGKEVVCMNYEAIPCLNNKISKRDFIDWLVDIEIYFTFHNLSMLERVLFAAYKLEGCLCDWWYKLNERRRMQGKHPISKWIQMREVMIFKLFPKEIDVILDAAGEKYHFFWDNYYGDISKPEVILEDSSITPIVKCLQWEEFGEFSSTLFDGKSLDEYDMSLLFVKELFDESSMLATCSNPHISKEDKVAHSGVGIELTRDSTTDIFHCSFEHIEIDHIDFLGVDHFDYIPSSFIVNISNTLKLHKRFSRIALLSMVHSFPVYSKYLLCWKGRYQMQPFNSKKQRHGSIELDFGVGGKSSTNQQYKSRGRLFFKRGRMIRTVGAMLTRLNHQVMS
jgi:hypothetical protein